MQTIQVKKVEHEHPVDTVARIVGNRSIMANSLGVTVAAIGNWKVRGVPIEKCIDIESLGRPIVTRRELRPHDWQKIWPELAQTSAAHPSNSPARQA